MNDKKFDKKIKSKINENLNVPDNINSLFSNFERRIIMENKEKKKIGFIKYATAIIATATVMTGSGFVFAHINGIETVISPLLRSLGISSKYEQEKININETISSENRKIELLDAAIDETSLIVGYKINVNNNEIDNYVDIHGEYKLNDLSIYPISKSIDNKNGTYTIYQLFDISEIDLKAKTEMNLDIKISNITTYTKYEDLYTAQTNYTNDIKGDWKFNKVIPITNEQKTITYTFDTKLVNVLDNVHINVDSLIAGAYTNILKIQTNKENYNSDAFSVYYTILDENNKEIVTGSENRDYDERIYNDRLALGDISLNQKITIKIYLKSIKESDYSNVANIVLDLGSKKEVKPKVVNKTTFKGEEYTFEYNDNWKNIGIATADSVGRYNRRVGALMIEIPNTTNPTDSRSISILTHKNTTLNKLKKELKENYLNSEEEGGFLIREEGSYSGNTMSGYKMIFTTNSILYVTYLFEYNNTVYEIEYVGSDIEYNNLQSEIEEMVNSFAVNK